MTAPVPSLAVRRATPFDRELLAAFLAGLSEETAYQRFLTGRGEPTRALLDGLLPEGPGGGALLGFVESQLVAHALWVAPGGADVADLAIVVADRHQRRGIGTEMALALLADLAAHGIPRVEFLTAAGNRAVARMVARHAPTASRELDGPTRTYSFPTPARQRAA